MATKWRKRKCTNCGTRVHLHANWMGLIGALASVAPIMVAIVAVAMGSWLVFWVGLLLVLALAGLAIWFAPLVVAEGE